MHVCKPLRMKRLCVPPFIGHQVLLLPVALGWSCGSQRVGFDAGSREKMSLQRHTTHAHTLAQSWWWLPAGLQSFHPYLGPRIFTASCLTTKSQSTQQKQLLVAAKHSGNISSRSHCGVYWKLPVFICFEKINSCPDVLSFHAASMPKAEESEAQILVLASSERLVFTA